MARVMVVNPPPRSKRKALRAIRRKARHFSSKARAAAIRNLRKARLKLKPRKKQRRLNKRFKNPFAGTLAIMGNPQRKRRKHTMARKHRRHHRRALSNPLSANAILSPIKELKSPAFIMEAAGVAAGFVLPNMAMNYLPVTWRSTTLTYYASKVGTIALLSAAGGFVSKRVSKFILVGGAVSLLLDLYTEFMKGSSPVTTTAPAPAATGTQAFYGNLSAYYGGMVNDWEI